MNLHSNQLLHNKKMAVIPLKKYDNLMSEVGRNEQLFPVNVRKDEKKSDKDIGNSEKQKIDSISDGNKDLNEDHLIDGTALQEHESQMTETSVDDVLKLPTPPEEFVSGLKRKREREVVTENDSKSLRGIISVKEQRKWIQLK